MLRILQIVSIISGAVAMVLGDYLQSTFFIVFAVLFTLCIVEDKIDRILEGVE